MVFGASGAFKSFYVLGQALQIAQTMPVVYIAAEGISGMNKRIDAWCEYYKSKRGNLWFIPEEIDLLKPLGPMTEAFKKLPGLGLVIIDTYARCLIGGDENTARDTGVAIRNCAILQRALRTAVTLIHHANKAQTSERGSGALRGAADSMILLDSNDAGIIKAESYKIKDFEPWPVEHYRFLPVGESGILLPSDMVNAPTELSTQAIKILEFLALEVFETCGANAQTVINGTSVPATSVYRILSGLKSNSQVVQESRGDPYHITDFGRAELYHALPKAKPRDNVIEMQEFTKSTPKLPS